MLRHDPRKLDSSAPAHEHASARAQPSDHFLIGHKETVPPPHLPQEPGDPLSETPPGESLRASSADPPPVRVGKYTVVREVGRGSFGIVYRALDSELNRIVALKVPRPEILCQDKTEKTLSRFQIEASASASLCHQGIVPIYEAQLSGDTPYIAAAYCTGPDLGCWLLSRETAPPPDQAARFVATIADAVQHAHDAGILHRDLKPANILLEPVDDGEEGEELADVRPLLTDFGLAKLAEQVLFKTRSSLLVGTPVYMAPEQLTGDGSTAGELSDVYALGVLLFELLTLRVPFESDTYGDLVKALQRNDPPSLQSIDPSLPADLNTIVQRCLAKDPKCRLASAAELRNDLQRHLAGKPIKARPIRWRDRVMQWMRLPERITLAGGFAAGFHWVIVVWMVLVMLTEAAIGVIDSSKLVSLLAEFSIFAALVHTPIALAGVATARGWRRTFWLSLAVNAWMLWVFIYSATVTSVAFEAHYPTPHSKIATFLGLIVCQAIAVGLHLIAIPAWLRGRRAKRPQAA